MTIATNPNVMNYLQCPAAAIVEGNKFRCTIPFSLTSSGTFKYTVLIPANHIILTTGRVFAADLGGVKLEVKAGPTDLVSGTQFPNYNLSGLSSRTSAVEIRAFTSATDEGTVVDTDIIPGSGTSFLGGRSPGSYGTNNSFRIYPPNSKYVIVLTNLVASANTGYVAYEWMDVHNISEITGS